MRIHSALVPVLLSMAVSFADTLAQITLSGTSYTQNFDSLSAGLPTGWFVMTNASKAYVGDALTLNFNSADLWSSSSGGYKNLASGLGGPLTANQQDNSTDRALGVRQVSAGGLDPGAAFVLSIGNTVGLTGFQFGFDFMILSNNARSTTWTVDARVGGAGTFSSFATITDPGAGIFTNISQSVFFGNFLDDTNALVEIRVAALSASTGNGSRDTVAIDNVNLMFTPIPEPSAVCILSLGLMGLLGYWWRRHR